MSERWVINQFFKVQATRIDWSADVHDGEGSGRTVLYGT